MTPTTLADRIAALDWSGCSLQHQLAVSAAVLALKGCPKRETEARNECARRGIDPDDICADGGVTAWMVVDQETALRPAPYFVSMYTDGPSTCWNVIDRHSQEWIRRFPTEMEANDYATCLNLPCEPVTVPDMSNVVAHPALRARRTHRTVSLVTLDTGHTFASAGFSGGCAGDSWEWIQETVAAECGCHRDSVGAAEGLDGEDFVTVDGLPVYQISTG